MADPPSADAATATLAAATLVAVINLDNSPGQRPTALQILGVSTSSPFSPIVFDFFNLIHQVDST